MSFSCGHSIIEGSQVFVITELLQQQCRSLLELSNPEDALVCGPEISALQGGGKAQKVAAQFVHLRFGDLALFVVRSAYRRGRPDEEERYLMVYWLM